MSFLTRRSILASALLAGLLPSTALFAQDKPKEIRIDWATYNPVSLVLILMALGGLLFAWPINFNRITKET